MTARFFSHTPIDVDRVALTGSEHQHMTKVMRLRAGDEVTLFDGSGWECRARIDHTSRQASELTILDREQISRELSTPLTLAVALPKGDRQQWLVEKATELGVTTIVPLVCERGVAQPGERARERMQKWVIAASKQCGRNRLLQIAAPQPLPAFLQAGDLVAHPDPAAHSLNTVITGRKPAHTRIVVGPEGGLTEQEVAAARGAACQLIQLGPRILRIETAALALIAMLTTDDSP